MAYLALARKWRPKSFATLIGQEHVVRALTHALDQGRLHHAYLLTGTRGVGKTTIARIMAKALNCESGVSATPCGQCASCLEIDGGRFIDYIELDAASNRGVDDMTGLLEKAVYAPTRGRYKVYVIDEVHQLTGHAFNAMLKTLEEPPEHVKFILATTDPHKIPVTVLSRCLQFNLKPMPQAAMVAHLSHILTQEAVNFEPDALRHLAKAAAGSMRDALSLLDQAIAHGAGQVQEADVRAMLGTAGEDYLFALLDALRKDEATQLLQIAEDMESHSLSFDSVLQELATLFHRIALVQMAPQAVSDEAERTRLSVYAAAFDAEFLQLCYQIVVHGRHELELAPDEFTGFSMSLMRLFAFRPDSGAQAGVGRSVATAAAPAAAMSVSRASVVAPAAAVTHKFALPQSADDWHSLSMTLPLSAMSRQLAQHCAWAQTQNKSISLRLPPERSYLQPHQSKLEDELRRVFGADVHLSVELSAATETPAARVRNEAQERQKEAEAVVNDDPFVREVIGTFNARIDAETIRPL